MCHEPDSDDDDDDADSDDDDDVGVGAVPLQQQAELSRVRTLLTFIHKFTYNPKYNPTCHLQRGDTAQITGRGNVKVVNPNEAPKAKTPTQAAPWYAFWRSKEAPAVDPKKEKEEEKQPLLSEEPVVDEEGKTDVSACAFLLV